MVDRQFLTGLPDEEYNGQDDTSLNVDHLKAAWK